MKAPKGWTRYLKGDGFRCYRLTKTENFDRLWLIWFEKQEKWGFWKPGEKVTVFGANVKDALKHANKIAKKMGGWVNPNNADWENYRVKGYSVRHTDGRKGFAYMVQKRTLRQGATHWAVVEAGLTGADAEALAERLSS